jgi:hypothetical protein
MLAQSDKAELSSLMNEIRKEVCHYIEALKENAELQYLKSISDRIKNLHTQLEEKKQVYYNASNSTFI